MHELNHANRNLIQGPPTGRDNYLRELIDTKYYLPRELRGKKMSKYGILPMILAAAIFSSLGVKACKPAPPESDEDLVKNAKLIYIATAKSVRVHKQKSKFHQVMSKSFDYTFEFKELLKGKKVSQPTLEGFEGPEKSDVRRNSSSSCDDVGGFKIGQDYLIFAGSWHPKAHLSISGPDDPWLQFVRGNLK